MLASPRLFPLLATTLALGCGAQDLPPPPPPPPTPTPPATASGFLPPAVPPPVAAEGTITRITSREQVPLTGPRVDAKVGDWLIENAGSVAVVASFDGRIVDFGPKGGRDELTEVEPTAFLGLSGVHTEVEAIELASEGHVLHVVRRVLERPISLHTFVSLPGDHLRVESVATARTPAAATVALTLGEHVGWGNVPTWAEGHGFISRGGTFITDFLARESFGVSYALCSEGGHLLARFDNPDSGFHEEASTGETPELIPLDAPSTRRVIALTHGTGSLGRAALALPCKHRPGAQRVKPPEGLSPETRVEVARCGKPGHAHAPFSRFWAGDGELTLPDGCFQMRLTASGHTSSAWFATAAAFGRTLPPAGRLHFTVTEKSAGPVPARVLVRGVKNQADPSWGDDPDHGAALNVVYAETGEGERPVPPGKYKVTVDRGFEYTAVEKEITVVAGKTTDLTAELERVVDTKGFIAADLHLHAMPSPDATQPLADRVRALVAGGVEVGVATDHNRVTDYRPVIAELKVGRFLASIIGDEVTTRDPYYGHFNAFPLLAGADPIPYRGVTPAAIFAAAHAASPGAVVQANHPRMGGIGYFDLLRFDREDVAGWQRRVPLGDLSFDAIEVFNGDHYARIDKVEECMRDWYALLDSGHRVTATGNSDSHKLAFHEAGVPRNLVAVASDDPAALDERAFVEAVRRGRVVVSSGPFIRLEAGGKGIGETIPAGLTEISITVDAPPWVDVDRVELVRRGELIGNWNGPFQKGKPVGPHRFEISTGRSLEKGDWIIAIARGTKPMTYLHRPNARPFAFTNPIWVQ